LNPFAVFTLDLTSLILTFAGQGLLHEDLALEDPVAAIRTINRHRWAKVRLKRGDSLNALQLQRELFAMVYKAQDAAAYEYTDVDRALADHLMDNWYALLTVHCV
jgi:hypothetical protein